MTGIVPLFVYEMFRQGLFGLGVPEIAVIAGVAALIFGPSKLPELGRAAGETAKSFQVAAKEFNEELKKGSEVRAFHFKHVWAGSGVLHETMYTMHPATGKLSATVAMDLPAAQRSCSRSFMPCVPTCSPNACSVSSMLHVTAQARCGWNLARWHLKVSAVV